MTEKPEPGNCSQAPVLILFYPILWKEKLQLVEKGFGCFRIDPPSALRLWTGRFRFAVSTTFLRTRWKKEFKKTISMQGLRPLESTAWDSTPAAFCKKLHQKL
ncbi:MAG TPA: hypothetical protein IAD19_01760 [Candidatus Egerieicola faecale]|uniref:Uncharacterized protein n=1 Tax=Candidatus Egerieicola faecale TaxID=2840774 RepID=A0A9D1LJQ1_9FIRM|nr:hypothetical protein [Candidatus Egerieicola faecale]